jgi:hypothetical protein
MTTLRLGLTVAILASSLALGAAGAVGVASCTQGTTPDCADGACGPGPVEAGPGDAVAADDAG